MLATTDRAGMLDPLELVARYGLIDAHQVDVDPAFEQEYWRIWHESSAKNQWGEAERTYAMKAAAAYLYAFDLYQKLHQNIQQYEPVRGYVFDANTAVSGEIDLTPIVERWKKLVNDPEFLESKGHDIAMAGLINQLTTATITRNILHELSSPDHQPYAAQTAQSIQFVGQIVKDARYAFESAAINQSRWLRQAVAAASAPCVIRDAADTDGDVAAKSAAALSATLERHATARAHHSTSVHPQHFRVEPVAGDPDRLRTVFLTTEQHHAQATGDFPERVVEKIHLLDEQRLGFPLSTEAEKGR